MYWDDEFALGEYDQEGWSIWSELSETVGLWQSTYEEYWGFEAAEKPEAFSDKAHAGYVQQYENADTILKMATSLTLSINRAKPLTLTESQVREVRNFLRAHQESAVVRDRIALSLARQVVARVEKAEQRAFRLIGLLLGRPLAERASSYISRATTLYVEGLPVETLVMCRAALEAALTDALADGINADEEAPPLGKLIEAAGMANLLDGFERVTGRRGWRGKRHSGVWRALRVKNAGDFVVHNFPGYPQEEGQVEDEFEAIRDLSIVLRQLFPDPTFE